MHFKIVKRTLPNVFWFGKELLIFHFSQNLAKIEMAASKTGGALDCKLLDKPVGFKCIAALLGVGHSRIRTKSRGAPDLRHGKRQYESKPGTWSVDGFLQIAYDSIAETLPDQSLAYIFFSPVWKNEKMNINTYPWGVKPKMFPV